MNKSLLVLAVLGAFAGVASAQSSVTVYGIVDTSVSRIDNGAGSVIGLDSGNNAASRIGFKGVENLGNGLKAEFVLENGINTDTGASASAGLAFSRLAYVGLKGGFGTVRLGKQNTQVKETLTATDPFGAQGLVNASDYFNGGGLDQRLPNQITYTSNNYAGFSATVGYVFGETAGSTRANRGYGLRAGYANGPLNVQLGYQNANRTALSAAGLVIPGGAVGDDKNAMLGATYNFGMFKLHGIYGQRRTDSGFSGLGTDVKIRSALVGVTVPFGASKIRAEYIRNNNRSIANANSNAMAVSYSYAMSKRTALYATYVGTRNNSGSDLGVGGPGEATPGKNGNGVAVGIQHNF